MTTEARLKQLSRAGRIGGLRRWIKHPHVKDDFSTARRAFEESFVSGHGCRACGPRVELPDSMPMAKRLEMGARLRRKHYQNLAVLAVAKRRREG